MKQHTQQRASGGARGSRSSKPAATAYMSEQNIQAYLMARDAIRRVKRTAPIFDSIDNATAWKQAATRVRRDSH